MNLINFSMRLQHKKNVKKAKGSECTASQNRIMDRSTVL